VPGQGIENERPGGGQYGLSHAEREERADTPTFPTFARDLKG
jgi:hypothetical protein